MIDPIWRFKTIDEAVVRKVATEFKLPEIYARVMALRGIASRDISRHFFFPTISHLHDPFTMLNMQKCVDRIADQLKKKKTMLVFGDYDVDGTTGTSLFYLFIKSIGGDIQYYIPNREMEGYGLSRQGIDYAKSIGADLLITVDCGINAVEKVEYANSLGVDVIITDHHIPDKVLPDAYAILNPKQEGCQYPFKGLCGAGVIFKLTFAIAENGGYDPDLAWQHADLAALGIAADLVPITDENRVIVEHGIELIQQQQKTGIKALLQAAGLMNKEITVGRLVFWLAPKINAAGRIGDAGRAVKLLTTSAAIYARDMANNLERENRKRQDITARIVEEAIHLVNTSVNLATENAIVLASRGWHPGVIGIVASRIKELYYRPTFIISIDDNGWGKGSGRSVTGFDLFNVLTECKEYLEGFGGHPMAAGLNVQEENIAGFRSSFLDAAAAAIPREDLVPTLYIDGELPVSSIDSRILKFLKELAPYGPGNMRPKFLSRNLTVRGNPKLLGRESNVLKFQLQQDQTIFEAIGFGLTERYELLLMNKPIDVVYEIGENDWNGKKTLQLELKDIKLGGSSDA